MPARLTRSLTRSSSRSTGAAGLSGLSGLPGLPRLSGLWGLCALGSSTPTSPVRSQPSTYAALVAPSSRAYPVLSRDPASQTSPGVPSGSGVPASSRTSTSTTSSGWPALPGCSCRPGPRSTVAGEWVSDNPYTLSSSVPGSRWRSPSRSTSGNGEPPAPASRSRGSCAAPSPGSRRASSHHDGTAYAQATSKAASCSTQVRGEPVGSMTSRAPDSSAGITWACMALM